MKIFTPLLFIGLLCAATHAAAQGYIFYWIPGQYQFRASFELTDAEMQPGVRWQSQMFLNSISITDQSGVVHSWSSSPTDGFYDEAVGSFYGSGPPNYSFDFELFDNASQTLIQAGPTSIDERSLPDDNIIDSENGYWVSSPIPEPSTAALLAFGGAAAWFVRRRKWR